MNVKEMTLARERLPQRSIVTRLPIEKLDYVDRGVEKTKRALEISREIAPGTISLEYL